MSSNMDAASSRRQLNRALGDAIDRGATVLHVEPASHGARLRARSVLELREFRTLSREEYADLWQNVADRVGSAGLEPFFEGSFPFTHGTTTVQVRVSILPTPLGASIVLKINAREKIVPLDRLGLAPRDLVRLKTLLEVRRGLIVFAGVSGSGGTTSLLSTVAHLDDGQRKLIALDDPTELLLEGVQQIQIRLVRELPERSITYERALRAAQMQNPDVLVIGHVRDSEAMQAALGAALSGVATLSRVHAPSAAMAIARLAELSPEAGLLSGCLKAVLAQTLLKRNCTECAEPDPATALDLSVAAPDVRDLAGHTRAGRGCPACGGRGVASVEAVFELLPCTGSIARLICERRPGTELVQAAAAEGMVSMRESIIDRARAGQISLAECLRTI